jgi:glucose-6-phosphate 1-dehydrogenase
MVGDAMLFAREDVVDASWAIVEPALSLSRSPIIYEPGSWGPAEADALVADVGGWNTNH